MSKRSEKSLSLTLVILIMIELIITAFINIGGGGQNPTLREIWNICFILVWILMLIYSLYILFQSSSRGFSIFVAIVTALAFISLTYHGLIMVSRYLDFMPKKLIVSSRFLLFNGQVVFYTSLFIVYIIHLINLFKIRKYSDGDDQESKTLNIEENTSDGVFLIDNDKN